MNRNRKALVAVSGYFNPLGFHHLKLFRAARKLGNSLLVIVNNDIQVELKGSTPFQPEWERFLIIDSLRFVDSTVISCDIDLTVLKTLERFRPDIFANGGDVTESECREAELCRDLGIEMVYGVGGWSKNMSSSRLIMKAVAHHLSTSQLLSKKARLT